VAVQAKRIILSSIRQIQYRFNLQSRARKFDLFWDLLKPKPGDVVLNIGATAPHLGQALTGHQQLAAPEQPEQDPRWDKLIVLGVNIDQANSISYANYHGRNDRIGFTCDACNLPFEDKSIDIVFSNAVLEHVPRAMQQAMAREIMRVGKKWFITTPNYWFPYEMHHKLPFFQFLPARVQRYIQVRYGTWPQSEIISLLSARRMRKLFSTGEVTTLRVTFWPETIIAYHAGDAESVGVVSLAGAPEFETGTNGRRVSVP
jgi:hypothetical protein